LPLLCKNFLAVNMWLNWIMIIFEFYLYLFICRSFYDAVQ
jgi:hypothetical protein